MIWLAWKLLTLPVRLVFGSLRLVLRTIRFVGPTRIAAFGAGVGVGMAYAPADGDRFRQQLRERYGAVAATGGDLAETVRYELAHSPRTWHLPQPGVEVDGGRVTLTGSVPHESARADLARTAGAIVGVTAVDNRVTVTDSTP